MSAPPEAIERSNLLLLASTFAIAACGLIYELLAGSLSSYLLGDSIYQFSIVIGTFMAAMGLGSYLSRYIEKSLEQTFVMLQISIGLTGGLSALGLFAAFAYSFSYAPLLILISVLIGVQIGFEIPIIIRILRAHQVLRLNVSNVLTADYLGALGAATIFPIVLVPHLGLIRTGLLFGLLNVLVAALGGYLFRHQIAHRRVLLSALVVCVLGLGSLFVLAERLTSNIEQRLYSGEVIYTKSTPYQRIVITQERGTISLFLDGALQFNSHDEYRYHESLVHPPMLLNRRRESVLILGGGDGLAVREVLGYEEVKSVTVVDLDPAVTHLFSTNPMLTELNADALNDPKVTVINADAGKYLDETPTTYDVIIIDLPDPRDTQLSRLYSREFYAKLLQHLNFDGVLATQATSPLFARDAFWSIERTLASTRRSAQAPERLETLPLHTYVPTFGEWGFIVAARQKLAWPPTNKDLENSPSFRFLTPEQLSAMAAFPPDMSKREVLPNTLSEHPLVLYYEKGWSQWFR